jgi:methylated-DNA-protein-cysteine methyltransferase related protein
METPAMANLPGFTGEVNRFLKLVWEIARQIPPGKVFTYGQIALLIPRPEEIPEEVYAINRARWVGTSMSECPPDVPWQRVINSQGRISLKEPQKTSQRRLLEQEGIVFDPSERINLDRFGWEGPAVSWIKEHGLVEMKEDYHQGQLPI